MREGARIVRSWKIMFTEDSGKCGHPFTPCGSALVAPMAGPLECQLALPTLSQAHSNWMLSLA